MTPTEYRSARWSTWLPIACSGARDRRPDDGAGSRQPDLRVLRRDDLRDRSRGSSRSPASRCAGRRTRCRASCRGGRCPWRAPRQLRAAPLDVHRARRRHRAGGRQHLAESARRGTGTTKLRPLRRADIDHASMMWSSPTASRSAPAVNRSTAPGRSRTSSRSLIASACWERDVQRLVHLRPSARPMHRRGYRSASVTPSSGSSSPPACTFAIVIDEPRLRRNNFRYRGRRWGRVSAGAPVDQAHRATLTLAARPILGLIPRGRARSPGSDNSATPRT